MNYTIIEKETASVEIEINELNSKKERLLQNFRNCQEGTCDCPTDQYEELESMEIEQEQDSIKLKLKPKAGKCFNVNEIENCVRYTINNLS